MQRSARLWCYLTYICYNPFCSKESRTNWLVAFHRFCFYLYYCLDIYFNLSLPTLHFHLKDAGKLQLQLQWSVQDLPGKNMCMKWRCSNCKFLTYTIVMWLILYAELHHVLCSGQACTIYDVYLKPYIQKLRSCRDVTYSTALLDHLT